MSLKGFMMGVSLQASAKYASKFSQYKDFYVEFAGLTFSKLSLGTYAPEPYWEDNYLYSFKESVQAAIQNGINVIDCASNYRYGQSEKEIKEALQELFTTNQVSREELILTNKGGFIQLQYPFPNNPYQWIEENILQKALATPEEIELDEHCMTPKFLEFSLNRSLENMGVEYFDIYFLHNLEFEKIGKTDEEFYQKIKDVFRVFESFVASKKIKYYGVATWNGLLNDPSNAEFISLQKLLALAQEVGGDNHHFKFLQVPYNLAKTSALTLANQMGEDGTYYTLVNLAKKNGLGIMGSSSLLRMNLFKKQFKPEISYLLDPQMQLTTNIQLALQFVRSSRGFITNIFGSKEPLHVKHNLEVANIPALSLAKFDLMFRV